MSLGKQPRDSQETRTGFAEPLAKSAISTSRKGTESDVVIEFNGDLSQKAELTYRH
jgi:hypothetical protein